MRQYWQGVVSKVYDLGDAPEVELELGVWYTLYMGGEIDPPLGQTPQPPLPRKGQTYWLIDDETFQKVKNLP